MATAGQIIGGVVGAIIGYVIGGPYGAFVGFSIGAGIGSYIDPFIPDVPQPGAPDKAELNFNKNEYGAVIPEVLGTTKIAGNILENYLNSVKELTETQEIGGKGGKEYVTYTTGYEYYEYWILGICVGPIDSLLAIYKDDILLFEGELENDGSASVSFNIEGFGTISFYWGNDNSDFHGGGGASDGRGEHPMAYRNMCHAHMRKCYLGKYNRIPTLEFVVRKNPDQTYMDNTNKDVTTLIGDGEGIDLYWADFFYNPAHAIYDILYNKLGLSNAWIDTASFNAAAITLKAEGMGICINFNREYSANQYVETLLKTIRGALVYTTEGKFRLMLMRSTDSTSSLITLDEEDFLDDPSIERKGWLDTINELKIQYPEMYYRLTYGTETFYTSVDVDWSPAFYRGPGLTTSTSTVKTRSLDFRDNIQVAYNQANHKIQGRSAKATAQFAMVNGPYTAKDIALRELKHASYPAAMITFKCNRAAFLLTPGDLFNFEFSRYGISNMLCRVAAIQEESVDNESIVVTALEDIDYITTDIEGIAELPASDTAPLYPAPLSTSYGLEGPYALSGESVEYIPLAARETGHERGYYMYMSVDDGTSYTQVANITSYQPWGTLDSGYTNDTYTTDDNTGIYVNILRDGDNINSVTRNLLFTNRNSAALINFDTGASELINFQTITPVSGTHYKLEGVVRGKYDTEPLTHAAGTLFYFFGEGYITSVSHSNILPGTTRKFKYVPYTQSLTEELSNSFVVEHTFTGRAKTPYSPKNLKADDVGIRASYTAGNDIIFKWHGRMRTEGAGIGDPATTTDRWNHEGSFELKLYNGEGGSLLRTITGEEFTIGTQPNYTYTWTNHNSDISGGAVNLWMEIKNYNVTDNYYYISAAETINVDRV